MSAVYADDLCILLAVFQLSALGFTHLLSSVYLISEHFVGNTVLKPCHYVKGAAY